MSEKPILFSGPMVRAILDGRKSQTRRVITYSNSTVTGHAWWSQFKAHPWDWERAFVDGKNHGYGEYLQLPSSRPPDDPDDEWGLNGTTHRVRSRWEIGDLLWVRETWMPEGADCRESMMASGIITPEVLYRADPATADRIGRAFKWRPSIFMPRWASRITLRITDIRVERVQAISGADAIAEGISTSVVDPSPRGIAPIYPKQYSDAAEVYRDIWDSINGKKPGHSWADNPWVWCITFEPEARTP